MFLSGAGLTAAVVVLLVAAEIVSDIVWIVILLVIVGFFASLITLTGFFYLLAAIFRGQQKQGEECAIGLRSERLTARGFDTFRTSDEYLRPKSGLG